MHSVPNNVTYNAISLFPHGMSVTSGRYVLLVCVYQVHRVIKAQLSMSSVSLFMVKVQGNVGPVCSTRLLIMIDWSVLQSLGI